MIQHITNAVIRTTRRTMIRINHQASLQVPSSHWVIGPQESFVSAIPMSTLGTQNCPRSSTVSISLLMSLRTLRAEMPYNKKIYSIKPLSIISISYINQWLIYELYIICLPFDSPMTEKKIPTPMVIDKGEKIASSLILDCAYRTS